MVAVIRRREDGRLLVIRRSETVAAPGKLCFPGGGIEAGEDEATALCRELREELRIEITARRYLWRNVTPWGVDLAFWAADIAADQTITPEPAEVAEVLWLELEELLAHADLLRSNHAFLEALRDEGLLDD